MLKCKIFADKLTLNTKFKQIKIIYTRYPRKKKVNYNW